MEEKTNFTRLLLLLFLSCLLATSATSSSTNTIATDRLALLSLKSRITSDPYNLMRNWTVTSPVCDWIGVTCGSRHHRVSSLNISDMGLSGEIPPELGNLTFLTSLDMSSNNFFGLMPQDLSRLRRLKYVRFSKNSFAGEVPSWFALLPRLEFLYLRNNSFSTLDLFLLSFSNESRLDTLDVSYNSLQGKIPESIGNLRSLKQLKMRGNLLSGPLPYSLFNMTSLETLILSRNHIEGILPEGIGNLRHINILDLQHNELTGSIPSSVFNISTLEVIAFFDNHLSGTLPDEMCVHLPLLNGLYLSFNELHGRISPNISVCSRLQTLAMSYNNFLGEIPQAIGELTELENLELNGSGLDGSVPMSLFNMTSLITVSLVGNKLSGDILSIDSGNYFLPNIEEIYLADNEFTGAFPNSIVNSSQLKLFSVSGNELTGPIPTSLGDLRFLRFLSLANNSFTSELETTELSFIDSLTNCRYLETLQFGYNQLNGVLPRSVGNLSSSLTDFFAYNSIIKGNIPDEIGNLSRLVLLNLGGNDLTGEIPTTLHKLQNLQKLYLGYSQIKGRIPNSLCELTSLGSMDLNTNQLTGAIPECLGNISSLREIYLNSNNLTSGIPPSIWNLEDLLQLNVASNSLAGSLSPRLGNLKAAIFLDLSMNQFSGEVRDTLGTLKQVNYLSLANNRFQGLIPKSIGSMISLVHLDLSQNNLNGTIPKSLEALQYLKYLNVSYNELSGEIPVNGPFKNFTSRSFMFNSALCGPSRFQVSSCRGSHHKPKRSKKILRPLLAVLGIGALIFIIGMAFIMIKYRRKKIPQVVSNTSATGQPARFSYYELLHATKNYSEDNLLGMGSFGSVYKAVLRDGTILAVKLFHMQLEGALKSFEAECEVLRHLRHRNLTKVLGSCTNQDFKAIVLEYMPNGSLDKCLYSGNKFLDVMQRLDIMIDVAIALEYLHHGYSAAVVHCDLKPGNVLLDESMVAHVSDFGMTKLLNEGETITHTRTLATLGYMAPEYGLEGVVSTRCDVYSYGIMLLETFTSKRPSDEMFSGDMTLKEWVKGSITNNALIHVIDADLISLEDENFGEKLHCISSIFELGLSCSVDSLSERKNIKDVLVEIKKIKTRLMAVI